MVDLFIFDIIRAVAFAFLIVSFRWFQQHFSISMGLIVEIIQLKIGFIEILRIQEILRIIYFWWIQQHLFILFLFSILSLKLQHIFFMLKLYFVFFIIIFEPRLSFRYESISLLIILECYPKSLVCFKYWQITF